MPQELYQVLATLCIGIGSLSSAFVAFVGYKLQKREKDKSWLQVFRDLYSQFWSDSHMARVRSWLACDAAYAEIEQILSKRLQLGHVEVGEYEVLESIDRFCSLVMEMLQMVPRNKEQAILHSQLIDQYWLNKVKERALFRQYVEQFWPLMGAALIKLPETSGTAKQSRHPGPHSREGNGASLGQRPTQALKRTPDGAA